MQFTGFPVPQKGDRAILSCLAQLNELLTVYFADIDNDIRALQTSPLPVSMAQFPLMVMVVTDAITPDSDASNDTATIALGVNDRKGIVIRDLGEQLYRLSIACEDSTNPSGRFRSKRTYQEIISDRYTLHEIANIASVYKLISASTDAKRIYSNAIRGQ